MCVPPKTPILRRLPRRCILRSSVSPTPRKILPWTCRNVRPPNVIVTRHLSPRPQTRIRNVKYLLLMYQNKKAMKNLPKDEGRELHGAFMAYVEAMNKSGVLLGNHGLRPTSEATTVRAPEGKASVLNGPYAETREQLAGYFLIDVPDLDAAIAWATRNPVAAHGSIEVRPVWA